MVELLLNTVWFALAVGAVVALVRAHDRGLDRKRFMLRMGALLCASALLFPSISITDDLHFDAFVIEDSSSTKRLANAIIHHAPIANLAWFGFIAFAFLLISRQRRWCIANVKFSPYETPFLIRPLLGRAPPLARSA